MTQSKILVDSNTYFRLAQSIKPLLEIVFGCNRYCLYIIDGFEGEYYKSSRLKTKFYWAKQEEFKKNRRKKITRSNKQKKEIEHLYDFVWNAAQSFDFEGGSESKEKGKLPPGPVDCDAIATAKILNLPIVSDDKDLVMLAKEFDIEVWSSLKLLKLMLDEKHINEDKIIEIVSFWKNTSDLPWNFKNDINLYFNTFKLTSKR